MIESLHCNNDNKFYELYLNVTVKHICARLIIRKSFQLSSFPDEHGKISFNELKITIEILQPDQSYSKMSGNEPPYNEHNPPTEMPKFSLKVHPAVINAQCRISFRENQNR